MYGPVFFENVLREILDLTQDLAKNSILELCRAHIGVSFLVCADVWMRILENGTMPPNAQPKHLLWALMKLNLYLTERVQMVTLKEDRKTVREWSWAMLEAIVSIKGLVVSKNAVVFWGCGLFSHRCISRSIWTTVSRACVQVIKLT